MLWLVYVNSIILLGNLRLFEVKNISFNKLYNYTLVITVWYVYLYIEIWCFINIIWDILNFEFICKKLHFP